MPNRIAGITIEIDGNATPLQKELQNVNKDLKSTQSSLRDVNKLLKLDPGNVDLLKQKQKLLSDAIADTKTKLDKEKEALAQLKSADQTPEVTRQMEALQRQIADDENKLKSLKDEMKTFGSVSKQQLEAISQKMKDIGDKVTGVGKKMTTSLTLPVVAGFTAAAASASDYEENLNKIDVAFGDNADEVSNWANNALRAYGLSKVAATDAVSSFGALGKGIGIADSDAAEMSTTLAGLSADLASYFNTGTDESAAALAGIFTGEAEALKKFGVIMNDTNLKDFAKEQGLVYSKLDQTEKTMLRYNFVLAKTSDAQGDYARTSDGTANSVKTFKAALSDVGVAIGTQLLPIITPLIQKVADIITKFSELDPRTQKIITIVGLVVAAIGPLLAIIGNVITVASTLLPIIGTIVGVLGGPLTLAIGAAIAIGIALYKNWDKIKEAAANLKEDLKAKWEGVKTDFSNAVTAIKSKLDSIKEKFTSVFDSVKEKVKSAIDFIKGLFNFEWNLPKIKLPHFRIEGSFSLTPPSVPHLAVDWYKKAYDNPVMFTSPTVLATPNGLKGFGDGHGAEIVMGLNKLKEIAGPDIILNMNVTTQPGQDNKAIADYVADRIMKEVRGVRAVWA